MWSDFSTTHRFQQATDPVYLSRGVSVGYRYDTLSRVTAVTYPTGVNSYSYDTLGRLASVTDPTGTTSYAFDALSRITGITTPQGTVGYSYSTYASCVATA